MSREFQPSLAACSSMGGAEASCFFFSVHLVRLLLLFSSCLGYSNCFIGKHLYSVVNEALLDM